jgi:hypothetical protein
MLKCSVVVDGSEEAQAEQSAGKVEQPLEEVHPPLVADAEAAAAEQPGEAALDHPAVPPEPLTGVDSPTGNPRQDATRSQRTAEGRGVVCLVGVQLGRALAGPSWFSSWPDDRRDRVDQRHHLS